MDAPPLMDWAANGKQAQRCGNTSRRAAPRLLTLREVACQPHVHPNSIRRWTNERLLSSALRAASTVASTGFDRTFV